MIAPATIDGSEVDGVNTGTLHDPPDAVQEAYAILTSQDNSFLRRIRTFAPEREAELHSFFTQTESSSISGGFAGLPQYSHSIGYLAQTLRQRYNGISPLVYSDAQHYFTIGFGTDGNNVVIVNPIGETVYAAATQVAELLYTNGITTHAKKVSSIHVSAFRGSGFIDESFDQYADTDLPDDVFNEVLTYVDLYSPSAKVRAKVRKALQEHSIQKSVHSSCTLHDVQLDELKDFLRQWSQMKSSKSGDPNAWQQFNNAHEPIIDALPFMQDFRLLILRDQQQAGKPIIGCIALEVQPGGDYSLLINAFNTTYRGAAELGIVTLLDSLSDEERSSPFRMISWGGSEDPDTDMYKRKYLCNLDLQDTRNTAHYLRFDPDRTSRVDSPELYDFTTTIPTEVDIIITHTASAALPDHFEITPY